MNISDPYIINPYNFTKPIYKEENLVGRDKIIQYIKNNFKKDEL